MILEVLLFLSAVFDVQIVHCIPVEEDLTLTAKEKVALDEVKLRSSVVHTKAKLRLCIKS